jgi:hypothetical protein
MQRRVSSTDRYQLNAEFVQLEGLSLNELRARWRQLYETAPPPRFSRDLLRRAVAYRMQEQVLGGLKPATRRLLQQIADEARPAHANRLSSHQCANSNRARSWSASGRGSKYRVVILESGVRFREQRYRSLSEVARAITGNRWSGPLFFGLKGRAPEVSTDGE